jgi:hypothetical protein
MEEGAVGTHSEYSWWEETEKALGRQLLCNISLLK